MEGFCNAFHKAGGRIVNSRFGHAQAGGKIPAELPGGRNGNSQPFGHLYGKFQVLLAQKDQKHSFLKVSDDVASAALTPQKLGKMNQYLVSFTRAESFFDLFETIDIQEDYAKRDAGSFQESQLIGNDFIELAPIGRAGKGVFFRQFAELVVGVIQSRGLAGIAKHTHRADYIIPLIFKRHGMHGNGDAATVLMAEKHTLVLGLIGFHDLQKRAVALAQFASGAVGMIEYARIAVPSRSFILRIARQRLCSAVPIQNLPLLVDDVNSVG
jgi:hypothetical protein